MNPTAQSPPVVESTTMPNGSITSDPLLNGKTVTSILLEEHQITPEQSNKLKLFALKY